MTNYISRAKYVEPNGYIVKPYQDREVNAAIQIALYKKETDRKLRESEERYKSVVDTAKDAIIIINSSRSIISWNRTAEIMFGYSINEIIGWPFDYLIHKRLHVTLEEEFEQAVSAKKQDDIGKVIEITGLRKDGEFPMEFSLTCWKTKKEVFFTIIIRDITERKRVEEEKQMLEAQLRHQQKLESIGTLASGVAHEINNPLMGMINYAELIKSRIKDNSLKEFSEGIIEEGDRVAKIVKNLLLFARQEKESRRSSYIKDIIDASLSLIGAVLRKDRIGLNLDIPGRSSEDNVPQPADTAGDNKPSY